MTDKISMMCKICWNFYGENDYCPHCGCKVKTDVYPEREYYEYIPICTCGHRKSVHEKSKFPWLKHYECYDCRCPIFEFKTNVKVKTVRGGSVGWC